MPVEFTNYFQYSQDKQIFEYVYKYPLKTKKIQMPALVPESEWYKELYAVVDEIQDFEVAKPKVPGVDCLF